MEVIVMRLKICEACGAIYTRPAGTESPYCAHCEDILKDFPSVESRLKEHKRGRPSKKERMFAQVAEVTA